MLATFKLTDYETLYNVIHDAVILVIIIIPTHYNAIVMALRG